MFGLYWINTLSWISTERQVALVEHIILITSQSAFIHECRVLSREAAHIVSIFV
jgi:hypothetical protein